MEINAAKGRAMKKDIRRIIVTGSSGTIGTALCERLIQEGYEVVGVDLRHNKWIEEVDRLTIIRDLRDRSFFTALPTGFDMLVHLAANARAYYLVEEPLLARDNFEMLFNVLEFCRLGNVKRFMFASSREVYGNLDQIIQKEGDFDIEACESPYAATKIAGEALVTAYRRCYGIDYVIFRFSNVYGKYDDTDRLVPICIERAKQGKDIVIFGKDKMLDFTYISDCIEGIMKSVENFSRAKGNVFNIACGESVSILEVARNIQDRIGAGGNLVVKESRTGEVVKFIADISKAKRLLNYEPKVSIAEGIGRTLEYYEKVDKFHNR